MSVIYRVEIFQRGRTVWRDRLGVSLRRELNAHGLHRALTVEVSEHHIDVDTTPTVAVALLDQDSKLDEDLAMEVSAAVDDGVVVIPVVDDLTVFRDQAPPKLSPHNGFAWHGADPETELARLLLEELGIEESDRKVFISHRRSDALGAAEQMHDRLTHHRFSPFIDRFAIRPGRNVQAEIADALEQFAFLLVLESHDAHLSDWVFDELEYALAHTMGVLIVQWPGNPAQIPGSDRLPRLILSPGDVITDDHGYDILTEPALDRVVREVEATHAQGIVRRRRMLLVSAQEAAEAAGAECVPLTHWCLDVTSPSGRTIVAVAPRLPLAEDLRRLDEKRLQIDADADGVLLHAARRLAEPRRRHLEWVVGGRNLEMIPDNCIGVHW